MNLAALNPLQFSLRLKHADKQHTEIRSFLYWGEQVIIDLRGVPVGTETHTHKHVRSEPNYICIPFSWITQKLMVIQNSLQYRKRNLRGLEL